MNKITLILLLLLSSSIIADDFNAAEFELKLYQINPDNQNREIIISDTCTIISGKSISGFIGPISIDIDLHSLDSLRVGFDVHLITLGPPAKTYSRKFDVEYELPATMSDIIVKQTSQYAFSIRPLQSIYFDTSLCSFDHHDKTSFTSTPTAHTDIYFVKTSLADYYFESFKELLETDYRRFQNFANITLPGKMLIYIYPCLNHTVIWDKRFGMAIDPTRNTGYALLNSEINTVDPFLVTHAMTLRNFGYAPPFFSEGLAGYFSLALHDMKKMKDDSSIVLDDFFSTNQYLSLPGNLADRVSATFIKYLVDQYGYEKFVRLYKETDDLNYRSKTETTYGKSIAQLEGEWKNYVDTVTINPEFYFIFGTQAEIMFNYPLLKEYGEAYLNSAATQYDSVNALDLLKRANFYLGDYYQAVEIQEELLKIDSMRPINWMALGSYNMINGEYEKGYESFKKAESLDTLSQMIKFNIASYFLYTGDTTQARGLLVNNISDGKGSQTQAETRIMLGLILQNSSDIKDQEKAADYFQQTIPMLNQSIQIHSAASSSYMWLGIAHLGLEDYPVAASYLHIAEFIETRSFYLGMINLWLGKTYLAGDELEKAKTYFTRVLNIPSSDFHYRQAKQALIDLNN